MELLLDDQGKQTFSQHLLISNEKVGQVIQSKEFELIYPV